MRGEPCLFPDSSFLASRRAVILGGMTAPVAYFNDDWIDERQLALPVDDLGCLLGATLVERLRTCGGRPFRIGKHLRRMRRSLEIVGWDAPGLCQRVAEAIGEFTVHNAPLMAEGDDWSLVVLITPGKTYDAAQPTLIVHGHPLPFENWAAQYESGVDVAISSVRQVPANCWSPELKCRSRIHYYLADREAAAAHPGSRALLLDQAGFLGEASTANVVAFFADRGLVTPRLSGVLPGISIEVLFELADSLGIPHTEDDLLPEQFSAADEALLTSTSSCVLPIVRVDGQPLGQGQPGPVFKRLLAAWSELVGFDLTEQARRLTRRS